MKFIFKGQEVRLEQIDDREDDCIKTWHTLVSVETGRELHTIDWSPYASISDEDLTRYLELGCPKRQGIGPLNHQQLEELYLNKTITDKEVAKLKPDQPQQEVDIF